MERGYVKLYRTMKKKGWYRNSKYVHLWVHILMSVNHQESEFMWNGEMIIIKAGQFVTGRKQLSSDTGIRQSTLEDILKVFENQHQIRQQKTNKFRLITVINWNKYQQDRQENRQQSDNKATTKRQQTDTNKNDKNEKNEKNNTSLLKKNDKLSIKEKKEEDCPMTLPEFVSNIKKSSYPHMRLIGDYAEEKEIELQTKFQWDAFTKRNLKAAKALDPFDINQIEDAVNEITKDVNKYHFDWTLETVLKYLTR